MNSDGCSLPLRCLKLSLDTCLYTSMWTRLLQPCKFWYERTYCMHGHSHKHCTQFTYCTHCMQCTHTLHARTHCTHCAHTLMNTPVHCTHAHAGPPARARTRMYALPSTHKLTHARTHDARMHVRVLLEDGESIATPVA